MRLREAIVASIRYQVGLGKLDRSQVLQVDAQGRFVAMVYRSKKPDGVEVKLSAMDCLAEDWILVKDGKEFTPDGYYDALGCSREIGR